MRDITEQDKQDFVKATIVSRLEVEKGVIHEQLSTGQTLILKVDAPWSATAQGQCRMLRVVGKL